MRAFPVNANSSIEDTFVVEVVQDAEYIRDDDDDDDDDVISLSSVRRAAP